MTPDLHIRAGDGGDGFNNGRGGDGGNIEVTGDISLEFNAQETISELIRLIEQSTMPQQKNIRV